MTYRTSQIAFAIAVIAATYLQGQPAIGQSYEQLYKWCYGEATDEQTIQGCNAVITASKATSIDIANAFGNRGFAYDNMGKYDLAIKDYNTAISRNPTHYNNYDLRGIAYYHQKEYDRAIADHNHAIQLNPKYPKAFNNRGNAYFAKKDYDRAIADYSEAIRLNPKYAIAFYNRGLVKKAKGDTSGGDSDIAQARQLQPNIGQ